MDTLGHAVTFPVNEMLLSDDGQASDSVVVNEMGAGGQQSFVFSSEGGTTTLLSLPFALLQDSGLTTISNNGSAPQQPASATNTTNIIIKQSSASSHTSLPTNTIFLDAAQMALLSSGAGQVVLTDSFLEDGQGGPETQQIFLQVTSDALAEEQPIMQKEGDQSVILDQQPGNQVSLPGIRQGNASSAAALERRPVIPKVKRGPGRPRREDSKMMPPSVKGVWFCQICGKEFSKWPLLKKHLKAHSDDKPNRCTQCSASFNVPWNLKLHEATHVSPEASGSPLRCPACSRTFSRIASLKAHIMLHEEDESLFCSQCSEEFSTQNQLDEHLKIHEVEANNLDPLAMESASIAMEEGAMWVPDGHGNNFSDAVHSFGPADQTGGGQNGAVIEAIQKAAGAHRCRLCNSFFRKASVLRDHMKEHSKVKASLLRRNHKRNIDRSSFLHKCKNCMKGFQKPSQLVRHMRIHTGERPYECLQCGRAFNQKGSLQIHMTKHSGIKPFTCEFCSAGFRQRGNLRAHILRVHTIPVSGEQAFRCCECPCVFRKLGSLNAHVSRVHGHSTTSVANGTTRKRKKTDGSGMGDSLDEDVSDVLRDLAELEEATRGLGGGGEGSGGLSVGNRNMLNAEVGQGRSGGEVVGVGVRGVPGEASMDVVHPSDILQQALEKSGLSGEGKKESMAAGGVMVSSSQDVSIVQENEVGSVIRREGTVGPQPVVTAPADGNSGNSQSCVLTLADKAHDGTVRRYSIKVRCLAGVRWHQCTYCPKEFKKPSDLVRHIRIHTHEKPYKCYMCFRAFAVKSTLTVHLRIHSGLKSYECPTCNKKFASQSSLKVHQRLHSGLKPFACPYCNLRFRTTGHRKTHVSTHFRVRSRVSKKLKRDGVEGGREGGATRVGQDVTTAIQRVFLRDPIIVQQPEEDEEDGGAEDDDVANNEERDSKGERELMQEDDHLTEKPVAANEEEEDSGHRESGSREAPRVTGTQMTVVENRPHVCNQCHAAFKKISHLKQHIRSHTGEKPFGCTSCNKAFVSRGVLRAHLKTHVPIMAPSRRPFECSECRRKFVAAGSLKRHMINSHENLRKKILKETYLCPYCDAPPFNSNKACRKHIITHTAELLEEQGRETGDAQLQDQEQPQAAVETQGEEDQMMVVEGDEASDVEQMQGMGETQGACLVVDGAHHTSQLQLGDHGIHEGTQLAVISEDHNEVDQLKVGAEEVMGERETENVVVTFSLDFPATHALGNQVINHQVSIGGEEEGVAEPQTVATISLADTEGLSQESLRQIEQTLSTGMFADAMDGTAGSAGTTVGHDNVQGAIKDAATAALDLHTISFDPSVFSNITLPPGEALGLHATLQPIVEEAMNPQQPQPVTIVTTTSESPVEDGGGGKDEDSRVRKKKIHKCSYCGRIFKKCSHLKQHLRTHTGEKPFQCLVCLRMFVTMGTLKAHFRTHTGEKSFGCQTCGAHFTTNGSLRRHMFVHTNEGRIYHCERCQQSFRTLGHWRRHWRSHENELIGTRGGPSATVTIVDGVVPCEEGVVAEGGEEALVGGDGGSVLVQGAEPAAAAEGADEGEKGIEEEETMAVEEPSQPVSVTIQTPAPLTYRRSGTGGTRRRIGTAGGVSSAASVIRLSEEETSRLAMQSPSQPHLTLSERVLIASAAERGRISEINDKQRKLQLAPKLPHACPHCPKSFRKPSDLARHVRTHTGERPFACDKCGRRFTVKSTLDSHRMTHPLEDGDGSLLSHPKYPCHVCGCLFATKGSLKVHMRLHTGARPFKCPHCDQRFRTSGHRKAHLLTHLRSQALGTGAEGGVTRGGRVGRGRRAKTMALEAMRTIDEALRDEEGADDTEAPAGASATAEEEDVGAAGVDWSTLQANLATAGEGVREGGGGGDDEVGDGKTTFVHLSQIDDRLILGQLPRGHHSLDEEDPARSVTDGGEQGHHMTAIDDATVATEVEGVTEALAFESADEVSGLFGGHRLEVILEESKVQQALREKEASKRVGGDWADVARGRPLGVLDEDGNISLVIDGDFVIEEDGTLRQVVGGECVVLSALGPCDDDDGIQVRQVDDGQ